MKLIIAIFFASILFTVSGVAEEEQFRLRFGDDDKSSTENSNDEHSKWEFSSGTSKMDDSTKKYATLYSEDYAVGWPSYKEKLELIIRCQENKTEIYIDLGMQPDNAYGRYNQSKVRIRLDKNKAFSEYWSESTDGKALFAPKSIQLAKKINKADSMYFEFTPFNSDPQIIEFDVRGLTPYLEKIAKTCNWKLK